MRHNYNLGFISDEDIFNEALSLNNTVYEELAKEHTDMLTALYLLAFSTYEGFDQIATR